MNLLKGNIPNLVKKIAIPASVGTLFQTFYNIVDTYFAGKYKRSSRCLHNLKLIIISFRLQ